MINKYLTEGSIDDLLEGSILDWFFPIWEASQAPLHDVKRWGGMSFKNKKIVGFDRKGMIIKKKAILVLHI